MSYNQLRKLEAVQNLGSGRYGRYVWTLTSSLNVETVLIAVEPDI
jgi:hypothetical protein